MRSVEEILIEIDRLLDGYRVFGGDIADQRSHSIRILKDFILSGPPECEHVTYDMCLHANDIVSNKCIKCGKVL